MDYLDHTIAVWQPYSERPLNREDAREITHNVVGVFRLLREWAQEEQQSDAATMASLPAERSPSDPNPITKIYKKLPRKRVTKRNKR